MDIVLIGYGKMGRAAHQAFLDRGHVVSGIMTEKSPPELLREALQQADLCVDFSHSNAVLGNIAACGRAKKNIVVGTTGWESQLEEAKKRVFLDGVGCLYAPNFSVGVHLFLKLAAAAASFLTDLDEYDIGITEAHHRHKTDNPSGTAKLAAEIMIERHPRKLRAEMALGGAPLEDVLQISSLRCGAIPGTHSVVIDSPSDTVTLTHQARDRKGFALGAVRAAEWLCGKTGFFTLDDLLFGEKK